MITAFIISALILLLSVPVFSVITILTAYLYNLEGISITSMVVEFLRLSSMPSLIAIPLFSFAGFIIASSKAPDRILNLFSALFGWARGGIVLGSILSASIFTAFSGASGITIIALGGLLFPILLKYGYREKFSLGIISTTGSLGLLFPPSLPIILYSIVAKIDLNLLFKKSLIYGIIIIIFFYIYSYIVSKKNDIKPEKFDFKKLKESAYLARWEIPLPFIVIGGIYSGMITASEAASITCFYAFIAECLINKEIKFNQLGEIITKTMLLVGAIFIVLATALAFTNYIVDVQLPERIFDYLSEYVKSKYLFLLILNIAILLINMIEIFSAIIIVVPIMVPIAVSYGIDPIHLAIIFLINLELGYMTPPFGINLFLSSMRFEKPLKETYKAVVIPWIILFIVLLTATYFPIV
ncbi:MAG TPA: TRAP transporter large permease subunit [Elusimicrobiales bacterium]|nr:TRAP transporter large permease subunit [Elusimicrobiales bacterium]HOL62171.1 TRAP transporter large permease subunit [Elusimicrobiales bacterium]HPO94684.1 TRAP transporter large permease subunit [Elusimicrobiales bacterium]